MEPNYTLALTTAFSKAVGELAPEVANELFWTAKRATDPIGKPYSMSTYTAGLLDGRRIRVAVGIHRKEHSAKISLESEIPADLRPPRPQAGVMEGASRMTAVRATQHA